MIYQSGVSQISPKYRSSEGRSVNLHILNLMGIRNRPKPRVKWIKDLDRIQSYQQALKNGCTRKQATYMDKFLSLDPSFSPSRGHAGPKLQNLRQKHVPTPTLCPTAWITPRQTPTKPRIFPVSSQPSPKAHKSEEKFSFKGSIFESQNFFKGVTWSLKNSEAKKKYQLCKNKYNAHSHLQPMLYKRITHGTPRGHNSREIVNALNASKYLKGEKIMSSLPTTLNNSPCTSLTSSPKNSLSSLNKSGKHEIDFSYVPKDAAHRRKAMQKKQTQGRCKSLFHSSKAKTPLPPAPKEPYPSENPFIPLSVKKAILSDRSTLKDTKRESSKPTHVQSIEETLPTEIEILPSTETPENKTYQNHLNVRQIPSPFELYIPFPSRTRELSPKTNHQSSQCESSFSSVFNYSLVMDQDRSKKVFQLIEK